jgi:hypothetical protein
MCNKAVVPPCAGRKRHARPKTAGAHFYKHSAVREALVRKIRLIDALPEGRYWQSLHQQACRRWGWLNSKRNCSTKASAGEALNHQSPFSAAVQTQTISVEQRYFVLSGSISIMPCWISRARRPEAGLHLRRARPCGADVRLSVGGYPDNARAKGEFHSPLDPPTNRARAFRVLSVARQTG